jgi:RNA recognition motif-containing protein
VTTGGRIVDRGETAISNKVFVGNLSFDVTRDELIQAFSAAGKVVDAKVPTDRETGRPRGFAFVEFEDDEAAQKSITMMNGKDLKGRPLRVNEAENRPPRPPGMGGPGGYRPGGGPGYRPGPGGPPSYGAAPSTDFDPSFERGRSFKSKGSRRNIRRRKRGFD